MPRAPRWDELPASERQLILKEFQEEIDHARACLRVSIDSDTNKDWQRYLDRYRAAIRVLRAAAKPKKSRR